jgi:hypothetical protein
MKLLLARTVLAGSVLGLTGCAAFDWWPQSTVDAAAKTRQPADDAAGTSTVTASSAETSAAAVATAPAPAPDVAAPAAATGLDSATMVEMLGMAWQGLKWPQPVDPAIAKYLGGFGVVVDMLQRGFDARAAREAYAGVTRLRDAMGPGETRIIHIRQGADGRVQVVEVPGRFAPIAKKAGEKVIESEIVTPEVVVQRDGSLMHVFTSRSALTQKARASYDQEWPAFYQRADAAIAAILARG